MHSLGKTLSYEFNRLMDMTEVHKYWVKLAKCTSV